MWRKYNCGLIRANPKMTTYRLQIHRLNILNARLNSPRSRILQPNGPITMISRCDRGGAGEI
jgi:hypothetical protein